jgi:hypothetical protein
VDRPTVRSVSAPSKMIDDQRELLGGRIGSVVDEAMA